MTDTVTHGAGLTVGLLGIAVMLVHFWLHDDYTHMASAAVFAGTLLFLYCATVLYRSFDIPYVKRVKRVFDHSCVLVAIIGTYLAFSVCAFGSGLRWGLFGIVWGLGVLWLLFRRLIAHWRWTASTMLALFIGWLFVLFVEPFLVGLPHDGYWVLAVIGGAYSLIVVLAALRMVPQGKALWR